VKLGHPFHAPGFLASFARDARRYRFADRTRAMHLLFSEVLPERLRARSTKAAFATVFWNRHSDAFAEEWEGEGADPELVRIDVLEALWRSPAALEHFRSATQLQAAWLARDALKRSAADRGEQLASRLRD
jgi:hypothetical protein